MPRPSIGETAMTGAERLARWRAARETGEPVIRIHRPADRRSRIQRWNDTIAAAVELQVRVRRMAGCLAGQSTGSALGLASDC